MATAEDTVASLRRNRPVWWLRRRLTQTVQEVQQVQNQIQGADPALAPLGTELADYSDEFDSTSVSGAWRWFNQGSSTATFRAGRLLLTPQVSGGAGNSVRLFVRPVPSGPWVMRTKMTYNSIIANAGGGLVAYRSGTGKFTLQSALARVAGAPTSCRLLTGYWTNVTTFGTVVRDDNPPLLETRLWTMQTRFDGTTLYFDYSMDNTVFYNITSVSASTALGGVPDYFGFGTNVPSATTPAAANAFEWFRSYSGSALNQDAA